MKTNPIKKILNTFLLCLLMVLQSYARAEIKVTYYIPDASGSPVAAVDEQGNVKWRKHYKPFGEEIEQGLASHNNHVGYTGHVHDRSTGLTYMGARYYDPVVGRFMAMDPAGVVPEDPRTFNRFAYGNNSPYKYVDPDGRNPKRGLIGLRQMPFGPENTIGGGVSHTGPKGPFQRLFGGGRSFADSKGVGAKSAAKGSTDPSKIRFSQDSIKDTFRDGRSVDDMVKGLKDGSIKPGDVPAIRTVERNGQLISIDNRRLAAFKEAGVPIGTRPATTAEIKQAMKKNKFSAGPSGSDTIRIRSR